MPLQLESEEEEVSEEASDDDDDEESDLRYEEEEEDLRPHGKGPTKYKPHPKKRHEAPYMHNSCPMVRTPLPKIRARVASHICPSTPPHLFPTLPNNIHVVKNPFNLRDPRSVHGFAEDLARDSSKNALAVREQREENVYRYQKSEGLESWFWCNLNHDFYLTVI
jgi:hypothetical protein